VSAAAAPAPQGARALLWLTSREWLGASRGPGRLVALAGAYAAWGVLVVGGALLAVHDGRIEVRYVANVVAAAWPLWAVIPLLGGGGGEVVSARRLVAYPVSPRAVFLAAWVSVAVDVPYVVVMPLTVGLVWAAYGAGGLLAVLAFVAGSSALGQLGAWLSFLLLSGRRRSGLTALLLTTGVVALLAAAPHLAHSALDLARALPSGWVVRAGADARAGAWAAWAGWLVLLALPVPIAVVLGPRLARSALDREAAAGGVGARPWGGVGWAARGSRLRVLVVTDLRSMGRAVGAQVALAGVLAVPALTQLPGVDIAAVSLPAMGSVAAIAAATVLAVNSFAFQAGGAALLLSLPVRPREVLLARFVTLCLALGAAQLGVTALGSLTGHGAGGGAGVSLAMVLPRTVAIAGLALLWSVRLPSASDYDSLRARIAAPRSVLTFALTASLTCYAVTQTVHDASGRLTLPALVVAAGLVAALALRAATRDLAGAGTERVVSGVAG